MPPSESAPWNRTPSSAADRLDAALDEPWVPDDEDGRDAEYEARRAAHLADEEDGAA